MRQSNYRMAALLSVVAVLLSGCALPSLPGKASGLQPLPDAEQIFRPLGIGDAERMDPALVTQTSDIQ